VRAPAGRAGGRRRGLLELELGLEGGEVGVELAGARSKVVAVVVGLALVLEGLGLDPVGALIGRVVVALGVEQVGAAGDVLATPRAPGLYRLRHP
jgi:hypothetical protein